MSGTVTIALPSIAAPQTSAWGITRNDATFRSPLSGYVQEMERAGAFWTTTLTWKNLGEADTAKLLAWYVQMSKAGTRCLLTNFGYVRHGVGTGSPLVNGGSQAGNSLVTDGWDHSITGAVAAGDIIQLATGQLVMATADAASDGSGNLTIPIEPKLRTSPADNSALTLVNPSALFMLPTKAASTTFQPGGPMGPFAAFSIDLQEDPQ